MELNPIRAPRPNTLGKVALPAPVPDQGLVTVAELKEFMSDIELSESQARAAVTILNGLQSELEDALNRDLSAGPYTETLYPDAHGRVYPKNTPVTGVVSVTYPPNWYGPSDPLDAPLYEFVGDILWVGSGSAGLPVVVTYNGGRVGGGLTTSQINRLKITILRAAAREMRNRHDDTLTIKDLTTRNDNAGGTVTDDTPSGFTDKELLAVSRMRRWVAV
jgi:hypothetical protein